MSMDFTRAQKRVTEILNACAAGDYTTALSARNKVRNVQAIKDAGYEAGLTVLRAIAETPGNEYRSSLISTVTPTHGSTLPEHIGKVSFVKIQPYSGAVYAHGRQRSFHKIESYRLNPNLIYDSIAHDQSGSSLSGYYDIYEQKLYFTGYAAQVGIANVSRDDVWKESDSTTKIPDVLEPVVVKLWVGNCPKAGEGNLTREIASWYLQMGLKDLDEFKAGRRNFTEVPEPVPLAEKPE